MRPHIGSAIFLLALAVFAPAVAYAQASLAGTVRDVSGAVIPGVTVEASSPALIEKVRSAITDPTGQYRIVDLRPGVYKVTFTLTGFSTVEREGIELTGTFTATVNADLKLGALEERITVAGSTPVVDVQNVRRQSVVQSEVIDAIPSSRTALSVATLIPGVTGSTTDVGGTNSIGLFTATAHGGRASDFKTTIDGFGLGNSFSYFSSIMPNMGSTQEIAVDVAAASAEQGPGGVSLNVVPKEGGNHFSGSLFASGANGNLQGNNFTQRVQDLGLKVVNSLKNAYDINPSFGGPILRDKIWFYASGRAFGSQNYVGGMFYNLNAGDPNAWTYVPDTTRPAYNISTQWGVNGRVTWQANSKQKIAVYLSNDVRCICQQVSPTVSPEAAPEYPYPISYIASVTWTFTPTDRLLVQAGGQARREDYDFDQRVSKWPSQVGLIPVFDTFNGVTFHATTNFITAQQHIPKARASLTYVGGRHEFKTGIESQWMRYQDLRSDNTSGLSYTFNNGVPISLTERALGFEVHQNNPVDMGLYAQDKMTWNRLTLNGGLRFEWYTTHYPDMYFGPVQNAPNRNFTVPGGDWHNLKDVVPRMGAVYDLFGNSRTAIKGSANKYMLAISGAPLPGNPSQRVSTSATRTWTDGLSGATALPVGDPRRGNFVVDCDLTNPAANAECGASSNQFFGQQIPTTTYDPATYRGFGNRAYNWEFSAGVQQQLARRVSVDVGYFRRIYGNLLVTDNRALLPSDYDIYSITAPIDPRLPGGGGYVVPGLYDLNPRKTIGGTPVDNFQTFASNFGNQYEHWNGVDMSVNARLPHGVTILGGFSSGRTSTDNCDVVAKVDNPSLLYCHVDTPFLTQVKAVGSYTIPKIDVRFATTFQSTPGPQITASYVASNAEVMKTLPRGLSGGATTVTVNIVAPGTMYGDRVNQVDLRFGKLLKFGHMRATANLDIYNALNSDAILTQSNTYGTWQTPQSLINARFAKVSVQLDF